MHCLDFLSESPKNFIFEKESNKTNFGGVLSLFYIIIMFFISLAYLLDYFMNDHYLVEYSQVPNTLSSNKQNFKDNPEANPIRLFGIKLTDFYGYELSNRFLLYDHNRGKIIYNNSIIVSEKISDINLGIIYKCEDLNCERRTEDKTYFSYKINIIFTGYSFHHQNSVPIKDDLILTNTFSFNFNSYVGHILYWRVVKYKEVKGITRLFDNILGNKDEYTCGYLDSTKNGVLDNDELVKLEDGNYYKLLGSLQTDIAKDYYVEYKRRHIGILSLIADLGALFSTIKMIFTFFFQYYSKNFNNYKIIEKILIDKVKISINEYEKNLKEIELKKSINDSFDSDSDVQDNIEKKLIINNKEFKETNKNDDQKTNYNNDFNEIYNDSIKIKKIRFFQFLFNNINFSNCLKCKEQEIISTCNEIILKYFSVDNIIYYLIKIENLFKDYKWNNPKLNEISNNEYIKKIKSLLI